MARSTVSRWWSGSSACPGTPMACSLPPSRSTASASGSGLRAVTTTLAPSATRRSATAKPMPLLAPVTIAVRPANGLPMSLLAELGNGLSGRLVLRFTLTRGRRRRQPCHRHHPPAGRRGDPTHDERQMSSTENTRAGASRARLVEAAVTAFAERGFHGTSTRDIAAAAGMSPAAVYVHHRSKEDLLYLISRVGHDDTVAVIRQAADSTDDPAARLA